MPGGSLLPDITQNGVLLIPLTRTLREGQKSEGPWSEIIEKISAIKLIKYIMQSINDITIDSHIS